MSLPSSIPFTRLLRVGLALGLVVLAACHLVACHNEIDFHNEGGGEPSCQILGSNLDFGTLLADGSFADRTFSLRNIGGGQLSGTIRVETPGLSIVSGGGFYSLGPGQLRRITVRFQPQASGDVSGEILIGHACRAVSFQGRAVTPQACQVTPTDLDFGTVKTDGSFVDKSFTISNPGPGVLSGSVSAPCEAFTILSGAGDFTLNAGESRTVTVRFQPATAGNQDCLVETGAAICSDVTAVGFAENPPVCDVEPDRFDFGTVLVGGSATGTFTLTNNGGGAISGTVSESCPAFSIVSGDGPYTLGPGEAKTVTVRFQPATIGADSCRIALGATACAAPLFLGRGDSPAVCELAPGTLDFGTVEPGGSADRSFTIRNTGGNSLSGNISEGCADFSITNGSGPFTLGPGASRDVSIRFQPSSPGFQSCTIGTGVTLCPGVDASGTGDALAQCETSVPAIDFGSVLAGSTDTRTFTLRNAGGGTLSGSITENCADFSIPAGGGPFSLGAGQEKIVTVRFEPATVGAKSCTIDFGTIACTGLPVTGFGDGPPACQVTPTDLVFGNVPTGSLLEKTFTVTNTGGGTLSGSVSENCQFFSIVSGGGAFNLSGGASVTVTVRFSPTVVGFANCGIGLGTGLCTNVTATGTGQQPTTCQITPLSVDFGTVTTGLSQDQPVTIRNTGGGTLTGNVSLSCPAFSITSGGGPFNLGSGQQKIVTVRFSPTEVGVQDCTLETGSATCTDVSLTGTGQNPPVCEITPTAVDFDTVTVGTSADRTFTIRNAGGGTLSGTMSESCPEFAIASGGGGYSLGPGASKIVTVRLTPSSTGTKNCTVSTGSGLCPTVNLTGLAEAAPACGLSATVLNFGTVAVGDFQDRNFSVTNNGGGTLNGNIVEGCADFSVVAGGGPFALKAGEVLQVVVRFEPLTGGNKSCPIDLGTTCSDVIANGTGDPPPECSVSPTALNFGTVSVNNSVDRPFTIQNTGGGVLNGSVTESCGEFTLKTNGGAFSLTAGASVTVTVTLTPTSTGPKNCTIDTGTALCADVTASGTADLSPVCQVSPTSLDFGTLTADGSTFLDKSFTITNTGGGTLNGTVSEACSHYAIISGSGSYSLTANQSRQVTVRFQPSSGSFGTFNCSITTGTSCNPVSATGVGAVGFLAHVQPLINGSCALTGCHNGITILPDFRVYATASSPTYVNTGTPTSSLLLLKPANQPNPDGLHGGGLISGWAVGAPNYNTTLQWIQQGLRP